MFAKTAGWLGMSGFLRRFFATEVGGSKLRCWAVSSDGGGGGRRALGLRAFWGARRRQCFVGWLAAPGPHTGR